MLISKFTIEDINHYLSECEAAYSFVFPSQYREFLLKYNGGNTPDTKFRIGKVASDLKGFYGFGEKEKSLDFSCFSGMITIADFTANEMFPIGTNAFGDYITIGIGQDNYGRVYFLYHDRPKKYIELSPDFLTFISCCKSKKIGYIRTIEERKAALIANGFGDELTPERIAGWQAEIDKYGSMNQEEIIL
jgi:hypothetical protein